jgi:hypothetical protein
MGAKRMKKKAVHNQGRYHEAEKSRERRRLEQTGELEEGKSSKR